MTSPWRKELSVSSVTYPGQGWLSGSIFTLRCLSLCHINLSGLSAGKGWQTATSLCQEPGLKEHGSVEAARVQIHCTYLGCKMSMHVVPATSHVFQDAHCRSTSVKVVPALCRCIHLPPSHKHNSFSPCPCESIRQGSWACFAATISTHCGNLPASAQSGLDNHYAGFLASQMSFQLREMSILNSISKDLSVRVFIHLTNLTEQSCPYDSYKLAQIKQSQEHKPLIMENPNGFPGKLIFCFSRKSSHN